MAGLYIHIPFCKKKCFYCDFYSCRYETTRAKEYLEILQKQLKDLKNKGYKFNTVYIGGGTPSVLEYDLISNLLSCCEYFLAQSKENTLEANPESLNKKKVRLLKKYGINRLSIGIQSFSDKNLQTLGRIHTSRQAVESIRISQETGFQNINIDLIFGIPGQTLLSWKKDLEIAVRQNINHISCYSLTYENKTVLYRKRARKEIIPVSHTEEYKMYRECIKFLQNNNFIHYEISNFAKKGFECLHNVNYWRFGEYTGLGPSASSFIKNTRYKNVASINQYILLARNGKNTSWIEEKLSPFKMFRQELILRLRLLQEETDFETISKKYSYWNKDLLRNELYLLEKKGYIRFRNNKVKLTSKGIFFFDEVASTII